MLIKQLDKWLRRTVMRRKVKRKERRSGLERRQLPDRRSQRRFGIQARIRRNRAERRALRS